MNTINYGDFKFIMEKEGRLRTGKTTRYIDLPIGPPHEIEKITKRILEITKGSTVLRSGNRTGHLTTATTAFESDAAHTNLVRTLVKYCINNYGIKSSYIPSYNTYSIDEAAILHDLAENETGDIPDNRDRNEAEKLQQEDAYNDEILETYPEVYRPKLKKLLKEMQDKSSSEGRILYVADKLSAIIMMLVYDMVETYPPYVFEDEKSISKISKEEIALCHKLPNNGILLSELWTADFLYGRKIVNYDDGGFYTAILVMATLLVHNEWYKWRIKQYF